MLRIGEFSVLSQITIHMLRHYDKIGLLQPEYTDQFTGYRYYKEEQLPTANKILALKEMGFSLPSIREILATFTGNDALKQYLKAQAAEQRGKIEAMEKQLVLIETTMAHLEHSSGLPEYSVTLKKFSENKVISCRSIIPAPNQEGILWKEVAEASQMRNVQQTTPHFAAAIFHDEGFVENDLDVEVQRAVVGTYRDTATVKFKHVEALTAATLIYKGHYARLPQANEAIARWIADNHYKISGPRFNIYHVSPETESSYEDMVTEVCFPVTAQQ